MEVRTSVSSFASTSSAAAGATGLGVFATRAYAVGEVICQEEAPLLRLAPVGPAQDQALATAWRRSSAKQPPLPSRRGKTFWQTIQVPASWSIPEAYHGTFKGMVQAALCWMVLYNDNDQHRAAKQEVLKLYTPNITSPNPAETRIVHVAQQALQYLQQQGNILQTYASSTEYTDPDTLLRVMLVWTCNAFDQGRVYHTMSRVNHSCNPNAVVQAVHDNSDSDQGQRLVAAAPIRHGDEIYISYAGIWLYAQRSVRQAHLLQTKHFVCQCSRCSVGQDKAASVPCFHCHPRIGRQLDEDTQYDDELTVRYTVPQVQQNDTSGSKQAETEDHDEQASSLLVYPCPLSGKTSKTSLAAQRAAGQVVQKTVAFLQDYERRQLQQKLQWEDNARMESSVVASSTPLSTTAAGPLPTTQTGPPPAEEGSSWDEDASSKLAKKASSQHSEQPRKEDKRKHEEEQDSSSDEDVFSNLAKRKPRTDSKDATVASPAPAQMTSQPAAQNPNLPLTTTSSMKRHHKEISGSRKAKMDALLQELESAPVHKNKDAPNPSQASSAHYVKGSYVPPQEEYTTTNLFVGNLSPTMTEPQVTNLFRNFGELYSVKIMWPRTPQDHARGRLTAFICYWTREDAEHAMAQCQDTDVFGNGRRLVMRWSKDVLKKGKPPVPTIHRHPSSPRGDHASQGSVVPPQTTATAATGKITTGRQLERLRYGGPDGSASLSPNDLRAFHELTIHKLTLSRESICQAMAFCFEKSASAKQIAVLLKNLVLDSRNVAVETSIARLYLLSDILFNSQQPGVRNAFLYRNAIEAYSPEIFSHLGKMGMGRIAQSKMETAVSRVLSAWTAWSVYTPVFIDQLNDLFHGKEVKMEKEKSEALAKPKAAEQPKNPDDTTTTVIPDNDAAFVQTTQLSDWTEVNHEEEHKTLRNRKSSKSGKVAKRNGPIEEGEVISAANHDSGELTINEGVDGESMYVDGKPVEVDGKPFEDDIDGNPVDEDVDGEPIDDDIDGESMDEDIDGEPVDLDGEPIDEEVDGELVQDNGELTNGDKLAEPMKTSEKFHDDPNGIPLDDDDNEEEDDEEGIDEEEEEALLDELLDQHIRMASSVMGARHWTTNLLLLLQVDRSLESLHGAMLMDGNSKAPETDLEALAATIDSLERVVRFAQGLDDEVSLHMGHLVSDTIIGLARALVALGDAQSQRYAAEWLDKIATDYVDKFATPVVRKVVANLHTAWQRQQPRQQKPQQTRKDNRKPPSKKRRR